MGTRINRHGWIRAFSTALGCVAFSATMTVASAQQPRVDFNRSIRPILSDKCFKCHGPDENERQAGLRFDVRESAVAALDSGATAIVPGKPDQSELISRIFSDDDSLRMPPPDEKKQLSDEEKEVLRQWISEGAEYQSHWSFIPPQRPPLPSVNQKSWPRTPVDYFILAELERRGLKPSPQASKETLIRRVTLDLTGLPPTPAEVDAFLADQRLDAYERLVDRLFNSIHHGERLALEWLDAARYADTHGYHIDSGRDMTRWREWVIDAFHRNKPFDQFTVEQLAGDLLPDPTTSQLVASGFNRNHMINFEGGAIPEEYHTAYIIDRVNTTATVWLGLTLQCSQCHDHKYDPFSQKDFYQLYAFFNNVPEKGLDGSKGNATPFIKAPSEQQQTQLEAIENEIRDLESRLNGPMPDAEAAQARWEAELASQGTRWHAIAPQVATSTGSATIEVRPDAIIHVAGANPATDTYVLEFELPLPRVTGVRIETLADPSLSGNGPGRSSNGNIVLTDVRLATRAGDAAATAQPWKKASADFSQKDFPVENAIDDKPKSGWAIYPEVGKPHFVVLSLAEPIEPKPGQKISLTLDFQSPFAQHQLGLFRVSLTDSADPHATSQLPDEVAPALAIPAAQRSDAQRTVVREHYRRHVSAECKPLVERIAQLKKEQSELDKLIPTAMVMSEMPAPRDTFILVRGQYDKHGEKVTPGVPTLLAPWSEGTPANRLGLARWLTQPSHPLTARVVANRYWQMLFGTGLVKTSDDFGSQGELPSHPQLLDWLAVEFREPENPAAHAWDVRELLKTIVMSATYQQSSHSTPELIAVDPENRWLARGPRHRLQAEFLRDQALAISGLLDRRVGGKSVFPYQPKGLWEELMSREDGANWTAQTYTPSHGADLYRRSMYTFWKRTSPPPTMATFDAPDRETCSVRRATTNTPLQALVLMNDPTFVEASRKFAERVLVEGPDSVDGRLEFAFRSATARRPSQGELAVLKRLLEKQTARYKQEQAKAVQLLSVGESPRNESLDASELAAWTTVCSALLNLDETLTKG